METLQSLVICPHLSLLPTCDAPFVSVGLMPLAAYRQGMVHQETFVSGFFCSVCGLQVLSVSQHTSELDSLLLLSNVSLYGHNMCFQCQHLVDICVFIFRLLWLGLLWNFCFLKKMFYFPVTLHAIATYFIWDIDGCFMHPYISLWSNQGD